MVMLELFSSSRMAWLFLCVAVGCISALVFLRAIAVSQYFKVPRWRDHLAPVHLLVVLGSGGHTAEMFSMLRRMRVEPTKWTHRTYVVSTGDAFSAIKAVEFESALIEHGASPESYTIVTVPRARSVHQSYLTAPFTTLLSFWSCLLVLRGLHPDQAKHKLPETFDSPYPDIVLTNGPATAVCIILAARLIRFLEYCMSCMFFARMHPRAVTTGTDAANRIAPPSAKFRFRTIFIESWARVTTLSLSGKILLPFADRFLVQWPALGGKKAWVGKKKAEYVGFLVE
ncbi:oligosaccharide biosynthesis protein Alg14-like protein [Aspergillus californicus]